jgi:hypothetical protein
MAVSEKMMLTSSPQNGVNHVPHSGPLNVRLCQIVCVLLLSMLPDVGFGQGVLKLLQKVAVRANAVAEIKVVETAKPAKPEAAEAVRDEVASEPAENGAASRDKSGDATETKTVGKVELAVAEDGAVAAENIDPFEQQFKRQFTGVMKSEVYFLNLVCETTPPQREKLKVATGETLTKVIKKFAEIQKKMNQGGFDWNSPAPDPRKQMQDELAYVAKRHLYPEQVALYETEIVKRVENRRRTSVLNVVARLDEELILTAEQRTKLTGELTTRWKTADSQQLEIFLYGDSYFPNVPEQFVTSLLNDRQKEIWRGVARNGNIFFGIGNFGNVAINDAPWAEDPPLAVSKVEIQAGDRKIVEEKKAEGP